MTNAEFPCKTAQSLGIFWLPDAEESPVPGMISVDGTNVHLEVSPEITPMFSIENTGPGRAAVKLSDEPDDMVVLGSIPMKPRKVTLWDAQTTHQTQLGGLFFAGKDAGPSRQGLKATWCVAGQHLPIQTRPFAVFGPMSQTSPSGPDFPHSLPRSIRVTRSSSTGT
ncbi:hypothetical protein ACRYGV_21465 [Mycobacteroides abscessus]